ncbi:MAG TPA: CocE/NonD family hydrolase [Bryobacteraceae bacterium]|nr:CocE/NonD family hydrolase [Bryobacteraceae bacterium]
MLSGSALAAAAIPVTVEGLPIKMRDGVTLHADVYRPAIDGRFPVILERTPYDKRNSAHFAFHAAAQGYVVVIQDVRGRYSSEGEWYPFLHESQDGYDTVEALAALPYSNGKVGMMGGSYVGATQMLAAIAHPPHLAGICPVVTASNYHDGWTYQGGAFEQWFNESWTSGLAQDTLNRRVQANTDAVKGMWKLPLSNYPLFNLEGLPDTATLAPYFLDWLSHREYDDYWKRWSIEEHYGDINVPVLTTAAWYDIFQGGSLRNYEGTKPRGGHLLVAIGGHAGGGRKIGDVDFGPAAAEFDEDKVTLDWYDYLFKGVRNQFAGKRVRIFVMGRNQWRDEDDWPLARASETRYYLHSGGHAASVRGDGSLSVTAPGSEPNDRYMYDPANPAPTIGGPLCCDAHHMPPGPRDQRPVEARDDVLVYSTPPFDRDTEVTGPVRLELYAASAAVDTDFTAKLVDVWPNGFAQNLTEGIIRARYRDSQEKPELMNPGQVYRFNIDLWSTSNVFLKGHRLRLEVSSSNFPRFDRNLNTGEPVPAGGMITATNLVYHDAQHPSALVVPVVAGP